jgi:hypothetical protein
VQAREEEEHDTDEDVASESCASEAWSCVDGASTNDASRVEERYVPGAMEALLCGGVRVIIFGGGRTRQRRNVCPKR